MKNETVTGNTRLDRLSIASAVEVVFDDASSVKFACAAITDSLLDSPC